VSPELFEEELAAGDGDELAWKIRAVHSSAALVVNTFACWKQEPECLLLAGRCGFDRLALEAKCPVVPGRRSAHLDAVAEAETEVVAVEAKLLEPLRRKRAEFAPAYDGLSRGPGSSRWFGLVSRLRRESRLFQHLDAAQLVKHALGLRQQYPDREVTLLYLFWEPINAAQFPIYARHRQEIDELAQAASGDEVRFVAQSYADLWASWTGLEQPAWLTEHLDRLISRYQVTI
jgi:hypothetical protein